MKRRTQVTISILLALGGTYLVADAFDLTPGVLTARPLEEEPVDFPSVKAEAALPVAIPTLDPNAPIPDAAAVDAAIDVFLQDHRNTGAASVAVTDTLTGQYIAGRNTEVARIPASNMKVLTAVAALDELGPDTTVPTTAVLSGTTLYLVGGGDILLAAGQGNPEAIVGHAGLADLAAAAAGKLAETGVTNVDVVVDSTLFTGDLYHPTVDEPDKIFVMEARPIAINRSYNEYRAFTADPDLQAGQAFAAALSEAGVTAQFTGRGAAPSDGQELARVESASIREMVDLMLTVSDNSVATTLSRLVGISRGYAGDFPGSAQGLTDVIREAGYTMDGVTIAEGSGLSIDDHLTTTILTEIFQDVYACDGCALAAIPSGLPVMGLNGTLYDRLGDEHMGGRVRAKTGTLIKSNSLSGYLMTDQGRLLTFSILVDGIEPGTSPVARDAQDDFLIALAGL